MITNVQKSMVLPNVSRNRRNVNIEKIGMTWLRLQKRVLSSLV